MTERKIEPGGLYRCCLDTLERVLAGQPTPDQEGDVIVCQHCHDRMVFTRGAWRWWYAKDADAAKP